MSVEARCTGCGEFIASFECGGPSEETQELLARLQKSPPFCLVCSCRPMAGPRPEVEFWERGSDKEEDVKIESMHDDVSY